jgi:spermidine/putrescine transport system substrate-binding protein
MTRSKPRSKPRFRPTRRSFLSSTGALAVGFTLLPRHALGDEPPRLNFYNWDTYIGETTLDDFREASGITVQMDLYADNDELFAKLRAGNPGYDVIVPTNDYVERMIAANMLMPLDHSKIPNMDNIEAQFRDAAFDPGRAHSIPYMWGTMGIGYRKSRVEEPVNTWGLVMEGEKYSGRISLLGDAQNVIGCGLKYLGYSFNSTNPDEIRQVEELLIANKRHIKVFAPDTGQDLLIAGEVDLCQEWNGDILQVMEEDDDLAFAVPDEGTLLWEDCLAIPTGAPHPDNAHAFINFILEAEAGAAIAEYIQYATPNAAAKQLMDEDYLNNPAIFPTDEIIAKSEASVYLGEGPIRLRDEAWTRIQAA